MLFERYVQYIKDNPKGYWFRARLFGWGWTPATWQGWLVLLTYILLVLLLIPAMGKNPTDAQVVTRFTVPVIVLTAILIAICYKTGERPRWNWGFPEDKKDTL